MAWGNIPPLTESYRLRCGVIGGEARGLGGAPSGMAGLVTSRFRVCTDLIAAPNHFPTLLGPAECHMFR
jgi:hypothetical protein